MINSVIATRAILDNFIEKLSGINQPLEGLKSAQQFKAFRNSFKTAIASQGQWAVDNLSAILERTAALSALNDKQTSEVTGYVRTNLPPIAGQLKLADIETYFIFSFEWGVRAQYQRWFRTKLKKAGDGFQLTNRAYIEALSSRADYLLNQSDLDETTIKQIIDLIIAGKADLLTNDEIGQQITDRFEDISSYRADTIARTETANAMGAGNFAAMKENGVTEIEWVTAGDHPCPICDENEAASPIDVGQSFPSGDDHEPAHPNCECYTNAVASSLDLEGISIWEGGDD